MYRFITHTENVALNYISNMNKCKEDKEILQRYSDSLWSIGCYNPVNINQGTLYRDIVPVKNKFNEPIFGSFLRGPLSVYLELIGGNSFPVSKTGFVR